MAKSFLLSVLTLNFLITYLFVNAPPPLPEEMNAPATLPIERVFEIAEAENDVVRALWTREIVEAGNNVGLQFEEDWQEIEVEAGPLPALFLRETAKSLEKTPIRLSLYLASEFPINTANRLEGIERERFHTLKKLRKPQFFYNPDTELYTGMFPDVAVVRPCVQCHNQHEQSAKQDWKLHDVMGATTWSFPKQKVRLEEAIEIIATLRKGFEVAYSRYLHKVASFSIRPTIGEKWPREGYFLPSTEVFMGKVVELSSVQTLDAFIHKATNGASTHAVTIPNGLSGEADHTQS